MKRLFSFNSINKRLITIFLLLSIIPLILAVLIITNSVNRGFSSQVVDQQQEMEHIIETQFTNVATDLLELTERYAENEALVAAFTSEEREQLLEEVQSVFPRLVEEHDLEVFEFGSTDGTVVLRGHNPEEYGDSKADIPAISAALNGESVSGFEFGSSGLAVRAFVPIISGNQVIGTLQTGVNDSFLMNLQEQLQQVTIDLYNENGTIITSSNEERVGHEFQDETIISAVKEGRSISEESGEQMTSYLPMHDPSEQEVIGMIGINQDMSVIHDTNEQIAWIAWLITIVTILVVIFVAVRFSQSISRPIKYITSNMELLSKGDLSQAVETSDRNDELGQLTTAMQELQLTLHDTMTHVFSASKNVAGQSTTLTDTANEVKAGSGQISLTMEELASGAEKQAGGAAKLAETMTDFVSHIDGANRKGQEIKESTLLVLEKSDEGEEYIHSTLTQMKNIHTIIQDAVLKMDNFHQQTQEVSKLIAIIEDIADQTNMLSLNAQIEAARAGESGKGFTVVANEVGRLANQVSESVTEIVSVVENIQKESETVKQSLEHGYEEVEQGTVISEATNETFKEISKAVTTMVHEVNAVMESLNEVTENSHFVNQSVEEIASISEESAAGIEEISATTEESNQSMERVAEGAEKLASLSNELDHRVQQFKL